MGHLLGFLWGWSPLEESGVKVLWAIFPDDLFEFGAGFELYDEKI